MTTTTMMMMMMAVMMGTMMLGVAYAHSDDNDDDGNEIVGPVKPKMAKFVFGDLYCRTVCQRSEGPVTGQCLRCMEGSRGPAKRNLGTRLFGDFGLDDYLFMRLLGRNLEDSD
ncbi:uncharacterized protein LOC143276728 [Babylonia areolata]|uniref:uncharacterized protein LOC143276728 n=1 Tax=Babylonia areolata TaxID=304850 RepID=UPI003FD66D73